MGWQ
jgi:hypothetical protein